MNSPIGIFDSGVGGTSIWKEISGLLPDEDTVYLADGSNAPYGEKSPEEILRLSIKNTELLLEKGCKLIVVACNTATTTAIDHLRAHYKIPFIGIEPAIKPAALKTKTKKVGVLATKGTLASSLFHSTSKLHASGIQILEQEGTGLVDLIESGEVNTKATYELLHKYLSPILDAGIDCLVLGCTHYPYLIPQIQKIIPPTITIIDSGEAVARQTKAILEQYRLCNTTRNKTASHQFFTNRDITVLNGFVGDQAQTFFMDF